MLYPNKSWSWSPTHILVSLSSPIATTHNSLPLRTSFPIFCPPRLQNPKSVTSLIELPESITIRSNSDGDFKLSYLPAQCAPFQAFRTTAVDLNSVSPQADRLRSHSKSLQKQSRAEQTTIPSGEGLSAKP